MSDSNSLRGLNRLFHQFPIPESSVAIWVEKRFVEVLVDDAIHRRRDRGDASAYDAYHEEADAIYDMPAASRDEAFSVLHAAFFVKLGLHQPFVTVVREFPTCPGQAAALLVAQVRSAQDESVDLERRSGDAAQARNIGVRIRAERFVDLQGLARHLRQEMMPVADLLDPAFQSDVRPSWRVQSPTEENLLRDRYRSLWCVNISGRLERRQVQGTQTRAMVRAEFDRLFRRLPENSRDRAFERLWAADSITHPDLMTLCASVKALGWYADDGSIVASPETAEAVVVEPVDGAPCPLCRFPTFRWVLPGEMVGERMEGVVARVRSQFRDWRPEQGICERCLERMEMDVLAS
ncbi:hypothetical protein FJZ36_04970 [Candidatus Poribacteria bacterium]|nr:hypothetical protein [Candidatus Poribacteria bacterium]